MREWAWSLPRSSVLGVCVDMTFRSISIACIVCYSSNKFFVSIRLRINTSVGMHSCTLVLPEYLSCLL